MYVCLEENARATLSIYIMVIFAWPLVWQARRKQAFLVASQLCERTSTARRGACEFNVNIFNIISEFSILLPSFNDVSFASCAQASKHARVSVNSSVRNIVGHEHDTR